MPSPAPPRALAVNREPGRLQPFFKGCVRVLGPDGKHPARLQGTSAQGQGLLAVEIVTSPLIPLIGPFVQIKDDGIKALLLALGRRLLWVRFHLHEA